MISVVIPTCDRSPEFLKVAVDSVLQQTLAPLEIIIVDNGVRDATLLANSDVVTRYRLPPRVGPSRARNFGAAMARGDYLAFLDDDDWWDIDFLQETWKVLQSDQTSCVYGRKDIYRDGAIEPYKCPSIETMIIPVLLRRNPCTGGINVLIKKDLFWRVSGFDEKLLTSEDKALAIEILKIGERISVAPKAATIVRTHDGVRARQAVWRKLFFSWKYRRLLGFRGILRDIYKISKKQSISRLKNLMKNQKA